MAIELKTNLEPFWDYNLADRDKTTAELSVNRPERVGSVAVFDRPWEGNGSDFYNIIRDDCFYRMYYLGWKVFEGGKGIHVCYAESTDGLHWERPSLGIYEFEGSSDNNILFGPKDRSFDNFFVMKDTNPVCPPETRYKATAWWGNGQLMCLVSGDGVHFREYGILSSGGAYDSVNTLLYNTHTGSYFCYYRAFHTKTDELDSPFNETVVRDINLIESTDFIHWSEPRLIDFCGGEDYPLYTNAVTAYPYNDRIYVGFPTRYVERRTWTDNFNELCGRETRKHRMKYSDRYGLAITDCVFMSSRDGVLWHRFDEAFMTPGPEQPYNWMYGDCYPAIGLILTPSRFENEPDEISILCEAYHWDDRVTELIRYTVRKDGFASFKAPYEWRKLVTKPFTFEGRILSLNFRTSARGSIYIKLLDENGLPLDGFASGEIFGDSVSRTVNFNTGLSGLAEKPVIMEVTMRDAEIYSMQFKN